MISVILAAAVAVLVLGLVLADSRHRVPKVPDNEVTFWKQYANHVNEAGIRPRANHIKD